MRENNYLHINVIRRRVFPKIRVEARYETELERASKAQEAHRSLQRRIPRNKTVKKIIFYKLLAG